MCYNKVIVLLFNMGEIMNTKSQIVRYESKVYAKGKTTLPLAIRDTLGIKDNDVIIYIQKDNSFEITTRNRLIEQMQKKLKQVKDNYSVDDFIADRRCEAQDELKD